MHTLESLGIARTYPVLPYLIYTLVPQRSHFETRVRGAVMNAS